MISKTFFGINFKIKVTASAKINKVGGWHDNMLKLYVTPPPENNKANKAVINLLAEFLSLPKNTISIKIGATSSIKTIEIDCSHSDEIINILIKCKTPTE